MRRYTDRFGYCDIDRRKYFYHWTDRSNIPALRERGLVPMGPHGTTTWSRWRDGSTEPRVYLTAYPEMWEWRVHEETGILLRVRRRDVRAHKGYYESEWFSRETVPPNKIARCNFGRGWMKL